MTDVAPRVLVAPDSFKGTFTAREVADALADALTAAGAHVDVCPVADGGEGSVETLAPPGSRTTVAATDPLGRPVLATYGWLDRETAIVETAAASGLTLVAPDDLDAEAASTAGTGLLVADAVRRGATRVLVACGGTATTDGGAGAIEAIQAAGGPGRAELVVLTDVTVAFEDAAAVFGPQKGADAAAVERLTARLHALASTLPRDPRSVPGTGAAGGLSGGLWATFGARIVDGAGYVLDAVGFDRRAAASDLVVTGEGRIDEQTFHGKLVGEIARRCRALDVPCVAVVGRDALGPDRARLLGVAAVHEAGDLDALERVGTQLGREAVTPHDRRERQR